MSKVIYLEDKKVGTHVYCEEMGDRTPNIEMQAKLNYTGSHYFIRTTKELKGRGITKVEDNKYKVTINAFEKLEKEYPIAHKTYLD